jgi:hypothetical protein
VIEPGLVEAPMATPTGILNIDELVAGGGSLPTGETKTILFGVTWAQSELAERKPTTRTTTNCTSCLMSSSNGLLALDCSLQKCR